LGEKEQFVKMDNGFMEDIESFESRDKFVYLLLKGLANGVNKATVVHIETIASIMGLSSHTKNRTAIKNALISLEENGLLLLYEDMLFRKPISVSDMKMTGTYYASIADIEGDKGFTKIYYSDLLKFIELDEKSKDLMFSVYFNIIKRIYDSDSSPDYSWVTIDTIEEEVGINRKTVMSKIAIMKEHELLYYETVSESADKDKNYYSRWNDRHMLIDALRPSESGSQ